MAATEQTELELTATKRTRTATKRVDLDECALAVLKHMRPLALVYAGLVTALVAARLLHDPRAVVSAALLLVPFVVGLGRPRVPRDYRFRRWAATLEILFAASFVSRYAVMSVFAFKAPRIWELPLLVALITTVSTISISLALFLYCGLPVKKTCSAQYPSRAAEQ